MENNTKSNPQGSKRTPSISLLNTAIITTPGKYNITEFPVEAANLFLRNYDPTLIVSYVGHEATATAMSQLLGIPVSVSRAQFFHKPGQLAIALKLRGRLAEGKILNREELEEIGYDIWLMDRLS